MIIINHILRFVGYLTLLPFLASLMSISFGSHSPVTLLEILPPVITFIFILGYGDLLRKKSPWDSPVTFWIANVVFYAASAGLVIGLWREKLFSMVESQLSKFHGAFIPAYEPYLAPDAVGGLSLVTMAVWMPVAAVLSMIALAKTLRQSRESTPPTVA